MEAIVDLISYWLQERELGTFTPNFDDNELSFPPLFVISGVPGKTLKLF